MPYRIAIQDQKEIEEVMTEIKDDIHELNKDLLRNFRNGGGRG